jgi:hypothetical protein
MNRAGQTTSNSCSAETAGMVVLDSAGRLSVSVGLGGIGVFDDGRANMCLDYEGGKEAACVSVAASDQYAAVLLNGTLARKDALIAQVERANLELEERLERILTAARRYFAGTSELRVSRKRLEG